MSILELDEAEDIMTEQNEKIAALEAEVARLRDVVKRAYLQNSFDVENAQACDKILANALGHQVGCWALASIPQGCSCGGVSQ